MVSASRKSSLSFVICYNAVKICPHIVSVNPIFSSFLFFINSMYMKCDRGYLSTLTCGEAVLRHFPTGLVHRSPKVSHYRSYRQLRYGACHTIPLMNEPLDQLAPLFPDLHLGGERVSCMLQKGLALSVLNLYHYSGHIFGYRRDSFTEVLRSFIQPGKKK